MLYKARKNEIVDSDGRQIAVVLPSGCTKKAAREMAAYCAQQMNHDARRKEMAARGFHAAGRPRLVEPRNAG